jgi:hypothetical protein
MIGGVTQQQVLGNVQQGLMQLRAALAGIKNLHGYTSALSAADLEGIGFSPADANAILSAMADAYVFVELYEDGTIPPSYGYTIPQAPYIFSNSQRSVIGPQ